MSGVLAVTNGGATPSCSGTVKDWFDLLNSTEEKPSMNERIEVKTNTTVINGECVDTLSDDDLLEYKYLDEKHLRSNEERVANIEEDIAAQKEKIREISEFIVILTNSSLTLLKDSRETSKNIKIYSEILKKRNKV